MSKAKMKFSRGLFWDVNQRELDARQHASFIIRRVLQDGELNDWYLVRQQYGMGAIRSTFWAARELDPKSRALWSAVFANRR